MTVIVNRAGGRKEEGKKGKENTKEQCWICVQQMWIQYRST